MRRLMNWAWTERGWLVLAVLTGAITIGSGIGLIGTSAYIISAAALHPSVALLSVAVVGVRFFGLSRGVGRYLERLTSHEAAFRILARVRAWWYKALEPLAPARLARWQSGDLLSRAIGDIDTLQYAFIRGFPPLAVAALSTVGVSIFLWQYSATLALCIIALLMSAGVVMPLLAFRLSRVPAQEVVHLRAALIAHAVDGAQGATELLVFGQASSHLERQSALDHAYAKAQRRLGSINTANSAIMLVLTNGAVLLTVVFAAPRVLNHQIAGVMLAVLALVAQASFEAVSDLPEAWQQIAIARVAVARLSSVVEAAPAVIDAAIPAPLPDDLTLRATHLSFRYTPDRPLALDDVSFTLPPGGHLVLVGASGSGKSTLGRLLLRLWDAPPATLTIGGVDICHLSQDAVRGCFAVIEQDPYMFNGTVRQNLLLAQPHATEEAMIAAAQQARLHDVILGLPQGYDTPLGERGQRLSDGERQRLAIARAILRDAPILLLDEASAYLDPVNERAVLCGLQAAMRGRTVIRITHRLMAMDDVTEIIVLDGGRVIERGTHLSLLAQAGRYAELWRAWSSVPLVPEIHS